VAENQNKRMGKATDRSRKALFQADRLIEKIGQGVYNLLATRGVLDGGALPEWQRPAEREPRRLHAEVIEGEAEIVVHITIPGFEPGEIDVTAKPRELVIQATHDTTAKAAEESRPRDDGFRSIQLPAEVDVEKVTSRLRNGILTIVAPKSGAAGVRVGPQK
jgi:HSP20 family molecular chaperone IbpA